MRLTIALIALAACKQDPKPAPAVAPPPRVAPVVERAAADAAVAMDAAAGAAAPTPTSALPDCPPSAYRNDGRSIGSVIPFVFPGCPPPELDLDAAFCATCARPCGYTRVTAIKGDALPSSYVSATYDAAGRLTALSPDPEERFLYDAKGRLREWRQRASVYAVERDVAGRITRVTTHPPPPDGPVSWVFHYDGAGRVIDTIDPYGSQLAFIYDAAGRQIAEDDAGDRAEFRYDPAGRLIERGTSWKDTLTYDAAGRLATIASGATKKRLTLTYDGDRLATAVQVGETGEAVTTTTYVYDCGP